MKTLYVYILTNFNKTVLYVGVTNNLARRLLEHYEYRKTESHFTGKYKCFFLVHFEEYSSPLAAIAREKEIKNWRRQKKIALIDKENPDWEFLNRQIIPDWDKFYP